MSPVVAQVVFWLAAVCCLTAHIALVWSAIRSPMSVAAAHPVSMPRRSSEIAWTILPAIGLIFLLGATWRAMNRPATHDMPGMTGSPTAIHQ